MSLSLKEIVSKIASQGRNPDVSFLKDNPEAQAMLLLAILSSANGNQELKRSPSTKSNKAEKKASSPKKVGRKPVTSDEEESDNPKSKRKAQNRAAQRAFRERKENQVRVLEDKVKELESSNLGKNEKLILENQKLKDMIKKLQDENATLLGSTVSFDVPLSSINGDDERPQKIKRQNVDTSPVFTGSNDINTSPVFNSSNSTSPVFNGIDISPVFNSSSINTSPIIYNNSNPVITVDDILNNNNLPSSALMDHSQLLDLNNSKIDFTTSQLDNILQQQHFAFETDPSQFDFFYPTTTSSSEASSSPQQKDIGTVWDQFSEHPRFDEFDMDMLCEEVNKKAVCHDEYDHDDHLKKAIDEHYPLSN